MSLNRRNFILSSAGLTLGACANQGQEPAKNSPQFNTFRHGLASGDPLADRVILWTRVTPEDPKTESIEVQWRVFSDSSATLLVQQGKVVTGMARDFTVKVDATGLTPGNTYFYEFEALGHISPRGRTRTFSATSLDSLELAVVSCANYIYGHFNVYEALANNQDVDAVLFLGDYLYEYANSPAKSTPKIRKHLPDHEITRLDDYRMRHAQYKRDVQLQAAHASHPFIAVWDDHESANNSWQNGAENHNPDEGEGAWAARKRAAIRAYFEWMPIRAFPEDPATRIYRSFAFGNLVDLIMLDTRLDGRAKQLELDAAEGDFAHPAHRLLSKPQENWLEEQLISSRKKQTRWRLIGQQVMFGQLILDDKIVNTDQWDGYPGSREQVLNIIETNEIDNVAILTGDIHTSWAMDISKDPFQSAYKPLAVEFVAPSVTSPGVPDPEEAAKREAGLRKALPHLHFVDLHFHGYIQVSVNAKRIQATWQYVDTILSTQFKEYSAATVICESGSNRLRTV